MVKRSSIGTSMLRRSDVGGQLAALQGAAGDGEQVLGTERLGDEADRAGAHRAHGEVEVVVRGDDEAGQGGVDPHARAR